MSIETWEAEFYPVEANRVSEADALEHSLRKWKGLTRANLVKHGCRRLDDETAISDKNSNTLGIDSSSCALCQHHLRPGWDTGDCPTCPLQIVRGEACCKGPDDPYSAFRAGDPQPMIRLLKLAVNKLKEKK